MYQSKIKSNKSKMSPSVNCSRSYKTSMSPKYDKQRALQNKHERQRINEQKFARFNQYNNLIASQAIEEYNLYPKQAISPRKIGINMKHKHQNYWKNKHPQKQRLQYFNQLKHKNQILNEKHSTLKSHLQILNSGETQLSQILEEVQMKYSNLKSIDANYKQLWILQNQEVDTSLIEQKNTKATIQFQSDRKLLQLSESERQDQEKTMSFLRNPQMYENKAQKINDLQAKFQNILSKLQKRSKETLDIRYLEELNFIENQLDSIKNKNRKLPRTIENQNNTSILRRKNHPIIY